MMALSDIQAATLVSGTIPAQFVLLSAYIELASGESDLTHAGTRLYLFNYVNVQGTRAWHWRL